MDKNVYIINATATKNGGALTILKYFLSEINKFDKKSLYYVFSGVNLNELASDNIEIIKVKTNGLGIGGVKRLLWDSFGLFLFCIRNKINPNLVISFQNTGVFYPKVKQLIYFHQSIPLYDHKWMFYRKDECLLFFYKNIYPLFIRLMLNKNSEVIVQQQFLKNHFSTKFHINENKIHVIVPDVNLCFESKINKINLNREKFHIFYPTNLAKYKNYDILFEAISEIKKESPEIAKNLILHITLDKDNVKIKHKISKFQISKNINLLGNITYNEVISYYNSVNLLVFPSYIETIGLPLIEAAYFGLPILVSDLEYAHEILFNYKGVSFVKYNNAIKWANSIISLYKTHQKFDSYKIHIVNNSMSKFLELFHEIINRNDQN